MKLKNVLFLMLAMLVVLIACKKPEDKKILPVVTTNDISEITKISATSGGNVIFDGGKMVTERGVCWDTTKLPLATINKTIDGSGEGTFISLIKNLQLNTTYYVRAYATTTDGTGYGNTIIFKTSPATTPILGETTITNKLQTSISWKCSVLSDGGAPVLKVGIRWGKGILYPPNNYESPTIWNYLDMNSLEGTITGLDPNTYYFIEPYATNSSGTGYGFYNFFKTSPTTPTLSTRVVTEIKSSTATSGGEIISNGGAPITAQGVCWSTTMNPTIVDSKTSDGIGTAGVVINLITGLKLLDVFTSSITGLITGTTYYIRAYATNNAGTGYGNVVSFTTQMSTLLEIEVREYYSDVVISGASIILYPTIADWDAQTNKIIEGFTDADGIAVFSNLDQFIYYVDVWEATHDNYKLRNEDVGFITTPQIIPHTINRFIAYVDIATHVKGVARGSREMVIIKLERKAVDKSIK